MDRQRQNHHHRKTAVISTRSVILKSGRDGGRKPTIDVA